MKLTALLLVIGCLQVSAAGYSQTVSIRGKDVPLNAIFASIEKQTGLSFFFNYALIKNTKPVTLDVQDVSIEDALSQVLNGEGLDFYRTGKTIFIIKKQTIDKTRPTEAVPGRQTDLRGRVVNGHGESLVSATVAIRNSKKATLTNEKGEFELKGIFIGAVVEISYLGYLKKEISVEETGNPLLVQLSLADNQLDEAHVIAYGQTTQRLSTSNMTMVKGKDIEIQPINNPLLALEGRVPGLFIAPGNGLPGAGIKVRIQGQNSISYGTDPLYVVDGVPYTSHTLSTTFLGPQGGSNTGPGSGLGNPLSFINPADIESVEVLKDADATAIYGSRAASGAILITTKRGKAGRSAVTFNVQNGWGKDSRRLPLLNTQQYLDMRHEALRNDGVATPSAGSYDINGVWDSTRYTDWQKTLLGRTAQYNTVSGSISGGNVNSNYLIGGTYHRETTVFPGDFNDVKGSVHFNMNTISSNQKLKVQFTGSYLVDNDFLPTTDFSSTAITLAPDAPELYKADGTLNWQLRPSGASTWTNPLSNLYLKYRNKTSNLIGNGNVSYLVLPGLEVRTNLGYTNLRSDEISTTALLSYSPSAQAAYGADGRGGAYSYSTINSWIIEPQLEYKTLLDQSKLDLLVGSTIQQVMTPSATNCSTNASLAVIFVRPLTEPMCTSVVCHPARIAG